MRVSERPGDRVIFSVPLVVKGVQNLVLVAFVVALFDCVGFAVAFNNDYWFAVRAFYYAFPDDCLHYLPLNLIFLLFLLLLGKSSHHKAYKAPSPQHNYK